MQVPRSLRLRHRRGLVLLLLSACIVVILGIAGLAIEVGYNQMLRTRLAAVADAAARAGALESSNGASLATIRTAGQWAATLNGYTDSVNGVTVTLNSPPSSGDSTNDNSAVEAILSRPGSIYIFKALNIPAFTIRARSVARPGANPT